MDNAVKFTDEGRVVVSAEELPHARMVRVDVCDTGCGVPSEDQDRIWDLFVQGDMSVTRRHGGTGIGLAMVLPSRMIAS